MECFHVQLMCRAISCFLCLHVYVCMRVCLCVRKPKYIYWSHYLISDGGWQTLRSNPLSNFHRYLFSNPSLIMWKFRLKKDLLPTTRLLSTKIGLVTVYIFASSELCNCNFYSSPLIIMKSYLKLTLSFKHVIYPAFLRNR